MNLASLFDHLHFASHHCSPQEKEGKFIHPIVHSGATAYPAPHMPPLFPPLPPAPPLPQPIAVEPLPSDVTPFLLFPLPLLPNPIAVAPFLSDIAPCLLSPVPLLPHPMPVEQLHCNSGLTASVASFPPFLPPSHQSLNHSPPTPSLGTSFCNVHSQRPLLLAHAVRAQVRSIQTCGKTVSPLR